MLFFFRKLETLLKIAADRLDAIGPHQDMLSHYDSAADLAVFIRSCILGLRDSSISYEDLHELVMIFAPTGEFDNYIGDVDLAEAIYTKLCPLENERERRGSKKRIALKSRFQNLWREVSGKSDDVLFAEIENRYEESHRSYHNLDHISACLKELDELGLDRDTSAAIELAIWFHDVIYEPLSKDNEDRSAEMFRKEALAAGVASNLIDLVTQLILATKSHVVPKEADTKAMRLFLDIDLSILGKSAEHFDAYNAAIREEFSVVPSFLYNQKRRAILRSFLERPALYFTEEFRTRYEAEARRNLLRATGAESAN